MSRRDQLRNLSAQIRTPPQPGPQQPPPAGESPHSTEATDQPLTAPAQPPHTPAPTPRRRAATPTVKTNLSLPPAAAERLREWSDATGRSLADGIITALINSGDHLEQQGAGEARRVQLGLPAITADNDTAERTVVTIRVPGLALEELDNTAGRLGLTRSGLAAALIDLHITQQP